LDEKKLKRHLQSSEITPLGKFENTSDYEKFMVFVLKERNLTRVTDPDASMIIWPDPDPVLSLNFFINAS
jgi:hypothetical protein